MRQLTEEEIAGMEDFAIRRQSGETVRVHSPAWPADAVLDEAFRWKDYQPVFLVTRGDREPARSLVVPVGKAVFMAWEIDG